MNLEFQNIRIVGDLVIADHPTLPSIDITRYLVPDAIDNLMAQESLRQIAERKAYLREMAAEFQSEALFENSVRKGGIHRVS